MMTAFEFWQSIIAWTLFFLTALMMFFVMTFTPAVKFLRAKYKKVPLFLEKYKDTFGEFKEGSKQEKDYTKVDGLPVHIADNSQIIEKKSKVAIYMKFAGHGINTNAEYAAIFQELNERGFKINKIEELVHLIKLTSDETYKEDHLAKIEDPKEKEEEETVIESLKDLKIEIQPYKTYTLPDLRNMFPFNINSGFMDGITEEEINLAIKREKRKADLMKMALIGSISIAILLIAAMIFFTMVDIPDKKVVCDCLGAGVKAAANNVNM